MIEPIVRNAEWLLFVGVLANQAGVPVPIAPWLLAAGVLAASGHLSLIGLVAGAAGATLGADLGWYGLGRWHGPEALTRLLRAFSRPPATVDRVLRVFRAHHFGFVWTARFLPELNPIVAGLAGVTGVGLPRFLLYASGSAFTWVGVWVGAGFLLAGSLAGSPDGGASAAGLIALILTATAGGALGLLEWLRRRRFRREVDEERTSLLELEPAAQRRPAHRDGDGARSAGSSPPDVLDLAERTTAA